MKTLRPRQEAAIAMLRESLGKGNKRIILKLPTGAGKTVIASNIIKMALAKNKRVIFCVNAISLVDQTAQRFYEDGITDIGVIQGGHELTNFRMPVQIASIQTLSRREHMPDADLVIIDEVHNFFKHYAKWMDQWNAVPFIGLSATPYTKGLGKYFEDLITPCTTSDLIDEGWLSKFKVYAPSHPDLKGVRTVAGDYHEGDLAKVMDKAPLIADVVSTWRKLGENRPTLCYAVDRAHAKHLQDCFLGSNIPCGYIDAYTDILERREIAKDFKLGRLKVICNVGVLTTGIDWDVRCIILARPTKSDILFQQVVGRGLRTAEGKDHLIILDHSDTHLRLGFVTDIDEKYDCLDDGKPKEKSKAKEKEEPLPKECPKCHFLKPAKVFLCPSCGFKPEKQTDIVNEKGELAELTGKTANKKYTPEQKKQFYGELIWYGRYKGYKPGWAANQYRAKFGVWPNAHKDARISQPTDLSLGFIKHINIKNAHRARA
jgi:DNA repair protein RadD